MRCATTPRWCSAVRASRGLRLLVLGVVALTASSLVAGPAPALADATGSQARLTTQGHDGDAGYYAYFQDVAYSTTTQKHLVVFVEASPVADSTDQDFSIKGQLLNASGSLSGASFTIAGPTSSTGLNYDWEPPSVAYDSANDRFLVAFTNGATIFGQLVAPDGSLVGTTKTISATTYNSIDNVDVVWAGYANEFVVAWTGHTTDTAAGVVYGRLVSDADGTPGGTADLTISNVASGGEAGRSLSLAYNTVRHDVLVAWQQSTPSGEQIWAQRIGLDGTRKSVTDFQISPAITESDYLRPRIAYDSGRDRYLVAFAGNDTFITSETEIWGRFVDGDGTVGTDVVQISDYGILDPGWGVNGPDVAYAPPPVDRYLIAFHASPYGLGDRSWADVYGDYLSGAGAGQGNRDFRISDMGGEPYAGMRPAIDYAGETNGFVITWYADTGAGALVDEQWQVWDRAVSTAVSADQTPPVTTITPSREPDGYGGWWNADVDVATTARDAYNGGTATVSQTRCAVDPTVAPASFDDLPDESCSIPTLTTEALHIVWAASVDSAGNKETPVSRQIGLDLTVPTLSPTVVPAPPLVLNQTGATVLAGASDSLSGIDQSWCSGGVSTSALGVQSITCGAADNARNYGYNSVSYLVGYKTAILSPAESSTWKAGKAVPIDLQLTDWTDTPMADKTGLDSTCPVSVAATAETTGSQTLASQCMKYSRHGNDFSYTWRLARTGTGTSKITVTVHYAGTTQTTTKSETITITPAR